MKELLTVKDWETAMFVQDACNLSGVVHSFSLVMHKIFNDPNNKGTDWVNHHPIAILFSSKIASLTGSDDTLGFSRAWETCTKQIKVMKAAQKLPAIISGDPDLDRD